MTTDSVDTRAIEIAQSASTKIDIHSEVCAERYQNIIDNFTDVKSQQKTSSEDVRRLYNRFWVVACAVISLLIAILLIFLKEWIKS